ncbi:MAG: dihydrofolate reductase family protein [Patescibacteria group bacterium]|jgi:dihydrofolate reductase
MKLILMMAVTADGIIAKTKNQNADWTTKADKKVFIEETKKSGAIIMGDTTFEAMGKKALPGRLNLILSLEPQKYQALEKPGELEFLKATPAEVVVYLETKGYQTAILGGGARTNSFFLKAGLVDEIWLTVEPKIFGVGINFTEGEDLDLNLELIQTSEIGDNAVQLRYKILK